jgi:hypothetical protein
MGRPIIIPTLPLQVISPIPIKSRSGSRSPYPCLRASKNAPAVPPPPSGAHSRRKGPSLLLQATCHPCSRLRASCFLPGPTPRNPKRSDIDSDSVHFATTARTDSYRTPLRGNLSRIGGTAPGPKPGIYAQPLKTAKNPHSKSPKYSRFEQKIHYQHLCNQWFTHLRNT